MKKWIHLFLVCMIFVTMAGCSGSTGGESLGADNANNTLASEAETVSDMTSGAVETSVAIGPVDLDLTALSSTMIYSEVYNMIYKPAGYIGKIVRMEGEFVIYTNQDQSQYYPALIISDSGGCCSESIEFVLAGENDKPENYPEPETDVTVVGRFETYEEDGYRFCHLVDAVIE